MFSGTCDFGAVRDCISGARDVDASVMGSIAVLSERLEKLRSKSDIFAGISFSQDAQEIASVEAVTALC